MLMDRQDSRWTDMPQTPVYNISSPMSLIGSGELKKSIYLDNPHIF